jgi:hypothetical protein
MHSEHAELSSVSSTLDDLTLRVTEAAERATASRDDVLAAELFEVERAMDAAARKLKNVLSR